MEKLYTKIQDDSSSEQLLKYPFAHKKWTQYYTKFTRDKNQDAVRSLRKYIMQDTLRVINPNNLTFKKEGTKYTVCSLESLQNCARGTIMYQDSYQIKVKNSHCYNTTLSVFNRDCLEIALELKSTGLNPIVLNNASFKRPGGGYLEGSGSQEENLFRRSTYLHSLVDPDRFDEYRTWKYPLPEFGGIYSPDVVVFRASETDGYEYLETPQFISFVAVSAYVRPTLVFRDKKKKVFHMTEKFAEKTKEKIRTILRISIHNHHDSIVISAFGCGAFMCPPDHISILFDQVLFEEEEFIGAFKHVSYAIIDDGNSRKSHNPNGNYAPFQTVCKKRQAILEMKQKEEASDSQDTMCDLEEDFL